MTRIRLAAAATCLLAAFAPATMGMASAAPVSPRSAPVPVLDWHACDGGFQCATARVPLDYQDPGGTKISLAVIRHLATDDAHRLGTMFVNLGGPMEQIERFVAGFMAFPGPLRAPRPRLRSSSPRWSSACCGIR